MPPSTATPARDVRSAADIRRQFIDYFVDKCGHTFVPSSPVVPHDDPTLLFTNAGMNQFKPIFLGQETRDWTRAVNTQKCIRAGGKHNDLEDVGKDTYHHTFFEMLGNWSFGAPGGYFKKEAIEWAWDLLVNVWQLDPGRLHATYFQGDQNENLEPDFEARDLWLRFLPPERVHPGNKKDNFWEMGDTGPCGPCSEIHFDNTPGKDGGELVNAGNPGVIEIWNLVFIQYNRAPGGTLVALPARHVDTGMGFERITRVIQGKDSNYDTDIFTPIFRAIREKTGAREYQGSLDDHSDIAYRVIADHIRCLTMAITDGATPSNEGRGYVLRRILRRAVRHAHQTLGVKGPVLCELVPAVVASLGDAFPELKKNPKHVAQVIRDEEEAFLKTLDRGIALFNAACGFASKQVSATDAFKLHDTYGFPIDLTRVMAEERGMTVDVEGYEKLMEEARQRSRTGGGGAEAEEKFTLPPEAIAALKHLGVEPTRDSDKFTAKPIGAKVKAIWNGRDFDDAAHESQTLAVILDRTNFYAEQGGQVGDRGFLLAEPDAGRLPVRAQMLKPASGGARFQVTDTQAIAVPGGGYVLHVGRCEERVLRVGDTVTCEVERRYREPTRANHTATHMLNLALRQVLGDDVQQKGSLVAPDRLRFDFSHHQAMTPHQLEEVQRLVSEQIEEDLEVHAREVPLESARRIRGVRAVFGEKYPDPVRVVSIGAPVEALVADPANDQWLEFSIEFCGGTHLERTSGAQRFVVLSEQALAAGVRRMVALTGPAAVAANVAGAELLDRLDAAASLNEDQLPDEIDEMTRLADSLTLGAVIRHRIHDKLVPLREAVKEIRKRAHRSGREVVVQEARALAERLDSTAIIEAIGGGDRDMLLAALDVICDRRSQSAVMLATIDVAEGKVLIAARVPKPLIARGLKAGDWVKAAAAACGGSGGGKPDMAQAGGKDPAKMDDAMIAARDYVDRTLQ